LSYLVALSSADGCFNIQSAVGNWLAETLITAYNDMGFDPTVPRFVPEIFITTGGAIRSKELPSEFPRHI
jgi:hypothetical protein